MEQHIYTGEVLGMQPFEAFSQTMEELILSDPKVCYIDADLMGSLKTSDLWKKYPKNVRNTGIQEANMVGVAAGLYLTGMKPYIHSFTPFASRRVFDQVFLSVGYGGKSVRIIGSDAGIMATYNGGTHMCFEDVAMMRTIPGACVVDITDATMFSSFLKATKDRPGVTYLRTARRGVPNVYAPDTVFTEGQGKVLCEGTDVTIVACGILVGTAITAAQALAKEGISARVVDIVTIKPLDRELLLRCAKETGAIVTAENHNVIGGLGSAVAEYLSEESPVPVLKVGVQDRFGQVGGEQFLREQYGLTAENIMGKVRLAISKKQ